METYDEIIRQNLSICSKCSKILAVNHGVVIVKGSGSELQINPAMWKHSENDVYHALIRVNEKYVFLCGTADFDRISLKRIRPIRREDINSWNLFIDGKMYFIIESENRVYEILNEDGTIVKDVEIEAKVYNHMKKL